MPSPTDFNLSPYYDDFNESKKFHRILFRPSFAVQARELTQSQSILQNQVENLSDHLFEKGAMVIPGEIGYNLFYYSVKLTSFTDSQAVGVTLNDFIGLRLTDMDGNANTVQEFECQNIPIIHNLSDYGIKWNNKDDIIDTIRINHLHKFSRSISKYNNIPNIKNIIN